MNILHVLSQFEVTGAETYAATLISEQLLHGHKIIVISDTLTTPVSAKYIPMQIGKRDFPQRFRNIIAIRKIIKENNINVVHTHSRAASWVSFFATRFSEVPLISSVHGRQHIHISSKTLKIYGEKLLPVCEGLKEHMKVDLKTSPERIHLVRNGINLDNFKFILKTSPVKKLLGINEEEIIISLIGRMSGPKGDVVKFFIKEIFPKINKIHPNVSLLVIGGIKIEHDFDSLVSDTNTIIGQKKIYLLGFKPNIIEYISASEIVVGSGRVAMESLAMGKPVIAIGESDYIGIVCEENVSLALSTNFGDTGIRTALDKDKISHDISEILKDKGRQKHLGEFGKNLIAKEFDIKKIYREVYHIYGDAVMERKGIKRIPILMYHKIKDTPPKGSRHGTYVLRDDFEIQLECLKQRGFRTVTFKDIIDFREARKQPPKKPVILTFDDGYKDNYINAFPLLKKYNMTGVIFLIGDPKIRENIWDIAQSEPHEPLLEKKEILEMLQYGIEFGSHTLTHIDLTKAGHEILMRELTESKNSLETLLGEKIYSICYPYGALNQKVKEAAKISGYEFGIASDSGPLDFDIDPHEIRRIQIFPDTGKFGFWKKTSRWYLKYKNLKKKFS